MVFLETNRTQIYRKYSPSQSSGERGVGLNTDGHGFHGNALGKQIWRKSIVNNLLRNAQENAELVGTRMDTDLHGGKFIIEN